MRWILLALAAFLLLIAIAGNVEAAVYHPYYGPYGGERFLEWQEAFERYDTEHIIEVRPKKFFGGCYIAGINQPMVADLDCDGVPDPIDNCPDAPNPGQEDQTGNNLGDACDLFLERITMSPEAVPDGRSFTLSLRLVNYRPFALRNIEVFFEIPELRLAQKEDLSVLDAGAATDVETLFRVPPCTPPGSYDASIVVSNPLAPGTTERFVTTKTVRVIPSGRCSGRPNEQQSIISILDMQDVDPERGAVYPFTIVNHESFDQNYILTIDGLDEWGYYQVEPRSLFIVPAGQSREGRLIVYANEGATGEHGFTLTVRSRTDAQQVLLTAHVERPPERRVSFAPFLLWGLLLFVLLILLAALVLIGQRVASGTP